MKQHMWLMLLLVLAQAGCEYGENLSPFKPGNLNEIRPRLEREKRDFLKIEDLQVGTGAIATWDRRIKADIEVRGIDGSVKYKGPIVTYFGFDWLLPHYLQDRFMLDWITQPGIQLGLNGMAVGGKRRITISPELVCSGTDQGCYLLRVERHFVNEVPINRQPLIVEATLTESCAPVRLRIRPGGTLTLVDIGFGCNTKDSPATGGADWHMY
jgi:hypothetical protein